MNNKKAQIILIAIFTISVCKDNITNYDFSALKGFTGNAEVECVRVPNTCLSNQQCPGGMICPDGICMLGCQSDNDCAGNERCSQGS